MTEDISFNSDYELIQSNDRIEQEESFKEVKINRNDLLKEYDRLRQILWPENQKIEELKQNFNQMIGEIKAENAKQISALKELIEQKEEKIIISFENKFEKKIKEYIDKKIGELNLEVEQKENLNKKRLCFVQVSNKWKEIDLKYSHCCENECINTENPIGKCIKGNGFSNIINDENIAYIECFKKNGYFGAEAKIPKLIGIGVTKSSNTQH
ncbi:hypothetical protein ACQ4LE_000105 [Meloidogyne hapla]